MPTTAKRMIMPVSRLTLGLLIVLVLITGRVFGQTNVVINFEKAEITGRWVDSWADKGVLFTPAHPPAKSQAKARLMFFPHLPDGHKGILSAMADDPIPVRAQFTNGCSSVTLE